MKKFIEFLNEAAGDWYAEDGNITSDGAGYSSMNIHYDNDGWKGFGKNKNGDVDARGFGPEKNITRASTAFTKTFKLGFGSMVAEYLLCAAKELNKTGKVSINLSKKYMLNDDNFDEINSYIKKNG